MTHAECTGRRASDARRRPASRRRYFSAAISTEQRLPSEWVKFYRTLSPLSMQHNTIRHFHDDGGSSA